MTNEKPTESSQIAGGVETASHAKPTVTIPLRLRNEATGESFEVRQTSALVGRYAQADVRIDGPDVSRRHCRILLEDGLWRIHDLGSTNGIYINGARLHEAVLHAGDQLWIGSVALVVEQAIGQRTITGKHGQSAALASIVRAVNKSA